MLTGLWTALPPLYDRSDKEVQYALEHLFMEGADGLFVLGTTGQGADFALTERKHILERIVRMVDSPHQIVAAISANPAQDVRDLMNHAFSLGVQGVALTPPFYGAFNQVEVQEWARDVFRDVVKAGEVYLYNMPTIGHTLWSIALVTMVNDLVGVDGIKDSSGDPSQLLNYVDWARDHHASVLVGDERLTMYHYLSGGHGVVSGLSAVYPRLMANLIAYCTSHQWESAIELQREVTSQLTKLAPQSPRAGSSGLIQLMDQNGLFSK